MAGALATTSGFEEPVMTVAMMDGFLEYPETIIDGHSTDRFCSVRENFPTRTYEILFA